MVEESDPMTSPSKPGSQGRPGSPDLVSEGDLEVQRRTQHGEVVVPATSPGSSDMRKPHYVEKSVDDETHPDYNHRENGEETKNSTQYQGKRGVLRRHKRVITHLLIFMLFTGWWITSLVLYRNEKNWVIPFLLWFAIILRLVFYYVPSSYVSRPLAWAWERTAVVVYNAIPQRFRNLAGAALAIGTILLGSFASEESKENTRENRAVSLFGMATIIFGFWITSKKRSKINWRTVIVGMLAQYLIGLFVLRTTVGYDIFKFIANRASDLLGFAGDGVAFLTDDGTANLKWFLIGVLPAIIFFISLVQVLYYMGTIQWLIKKVATFIFWGMRVSGAEAVVAAATPFIGQGESAILVHPFVRHMTDAEIHQIMTCGFATISGSVLVGYVGLGLNAQALVSSCIMSIPASLAISKLRYPETEEALTAGGVVVPEDNEEYNAENALHAFSKGAWFGLKIAGSILCSLLCIIAFVGLVNALFTWWGRYLGINSPNLTLQLMLGYIMYPVAFLLGIPRNGDLLKVARLIAEKIITVSQSKHVKPFLVLTWAVHQNEYNAFRALSDDPDYADLSSRSRLIATYALCGFGNIGSLGVQIGILSQLAPSRAGDVSRLAISALVSGVMATLTSATVAGLVVTDQLDSFISN